MLGPSCLDYSVLLSCPVRPREMWKLSDRLYRSMLSNIGWCWPIQTCYSARIYTLSNSTRICMPITCLYISPRTAFVFSLFSCWFSEPNRTPRTWDIFRICWQKDSSQKNKLLISADFYARQTRRQDVWKLFSFSFWVVLHLLSFHFPLFCYGATLWDLRSGPGIVGVNKSPWLYC